jgi:hydrogenase expression/formation protein HypE
VISIRFRLKRNGNFKDVLMKLPVHSITGIRFRSSDQRLFAVNISLQFSVCWFLLRFSSTSFHFFLMGEFVYLTHVHSSVCHSPHSAFIWKTDPITFETPEPGKYGIMVNLNDLTCMGAVPHSLLCTWLLPTTFSAADFRKLQQQMQETADRFDIAVVGGHTEFTSAVRSPIVNITMIGFTPLPYLPSLQPLAGDALLLMGFVGAEGTAILGHKIQQTLKKYPEFRGQVPGAVMEHLFDGLPLMDGQLSVHHDGLQLNRLLRPSRMHDPTEGGVFGAIGELFSATVGETETAERTNVGSTDNLGNGVELDRAALDTHLHPLTKALCEWLHVDPFRLISSGSLVLVLPSQAISEAMKKLNAIQLTHKVSRVGTVIRERVCRIGKDEVLEPPMPDAIIAALRTFNDLLPTETKVD